MPLNDVDMKTGVVTLLVDREVVRSGGADAQASQPLFRILPWAEFQSGSETEPRYMIPTLHALGLLSEDNFGGSDCARVREQTARLTAMPQEPAVPDNGVTGIHFYGTV